MLRGIQIYGGTAVWCQNQCLGARRYTHCYTTNTAVKKSDHERNANF